MNERSPSTRQAQRTATPHVATASRAVFTRPVHASEVELTTGLYRERVAPAHPSAINRSVLLDAQVTGRCHGGKGCTREGKLLVRRRLHGKTNGTGNAEVRHVGG